MVWERLRVCGMCSAISETGQEETHTVRDSYRAVNEWMPQLKQQHSKTTVRILDSE